MYTLYVNGNEIEIFETLEEAIVNAKHYVGDIEVRDGEYNRLYTFFQSC